MHELHRSRPSNQQLVALVAVTFWLVFAFWQYREFSHQEKLIHDSLVSQARSLSGAVSSGVRSHRWFSPFVQQQLPETLTVLARAENVVAIALVDLSNPDGLYFAGKRERIQIDLPAGEHFLGNELHLVRDFSLQSSPPMMRSGTLPNPEMVTTDQFKSVVILDRSNSITQLRREAVSRLLIFGLGTLLLIALAAVWQFTVRLAQSEGATQLLSAETRHLRELGQAAAGLAHETRNPLGLIRGWTQRLVETGLPTEDQQEQAEAVLEECDRVTARINQFLAFARQAELQVEPVDLADVVHELRSLMQWDLQQAELELEIAGIETASTIRADREQLRQLLFNLLQNAISFAPPASKITISLVRSQHSTFRLSVADQGPGLEPEIIDTVFDPYVTRRPGGTGLGLSIVRRIALAHGWNVGYEAAAHGGAVFWVDGIEKC